MACNGNCNCNCEKEDDWKDYIYDESGFIIGRAGPKMEPDAPSITTYVTDEIISYKYAEDRMIADLQDYINSTYGEHYMTENQSIECFDAWIALGDSTPTFRNTALKYLWRYGKKNGNNKKDLLKTLHYVLMCLYVDHYKDNK